MTYERCKNVFERRIIVLFVRMFAMFISMWFSNLWVYRIEIHFTYYCVRSRVLVMRVTWERDRKDLLGHPQSFWRTSVELSHPKCFKKSRQNTLKANLVTSPRHKLFALFTGYHQQRGLTVGLLQASEESLSWSTVKVHALYFT